MSSSIPSIPYDRRVTFVTGAAGGIGRESAMAFARRGDAVALADLELTRVTALQYARFKHWARGDFATAPYPGNVASLDAVPLELQPEYLTRAQLESAVCFAGNGQAREDHEL